MDICVIFIAVGEVIMFVLCVEIDFKILMIIVNNLNNLVKYKEENIRNTTSGDRH